MSNTRHDAVSIQATSAETILFIEPNCALSSGFMFGVQNNADIEMIVIMEKENIQRF
jgi:hypothetical protein